jgi:hypothetical protein
MEGLLVDGSSAYYKKGESPLQLLVLDKWHHITQVHCPDLLLYALEYQVVLGVLLFKSCFLVSGCMHSTSVFCRFS